LFPYANAGPATVDIGMHIIIVALEIWAFVIVWRIIKKEKALAT
jgi:hypothetical protein